jgi:hypothetical protein
MTALVIPNAIQVATLHSRYQFASFLSRDTTYDLIVNIWRIIHPTVPQTALADTALSDGDDGEEDEGEGEEPGKRRLLGTRRKRKNTNAAPTLATTSSGSVLLVDSPTSAGLTPGSPKATAPHPPTTCRCGTSEPAHYPNVCMDAQFATTPEKLYNLMFTSGFIKTFWSDNQKLFGSR